jgi:hypothetical protein
VGEKVVERLRMLIHDVVAGCWKIEEDIRGRMFPYRCGLYLKELAGLQKTKKTCQH